MCKMQHDIDDILNRFDTFRETKESEKPKDSYNCEHCGESNLVLLDGNVTCGSCHTVNARQLDASAEWRTFFESNTSNFSKDRSRCGAPVSDLLPQTSFSSCIGYTGAFDSKEIQGIRKYNFWSSLTYSDRSTLKVFDILSMISKNNGLSTSIIEQAKFYFVSIKANKSVFRGANKVGIVASCIYNACKKEGVPRSCVEIARMFDVDPNVVNKGCRLFKEQMPDIDMHIEPCGATDFVGRFCGNLRLDSVKTTEVMERVQKCEKMQRHTPMSLVAGCIFSLSKTWQNNGNPTKAEIAISCKVSVVTVAKVCKDIEVYIKSVS